MGRQAATIQVNSTLPKRPRRSPLANRSKLNVRNREEGYHYRIVNANLERDPERVQEFLDRGYELVPKDKIEMETKGVDSIVSMGSAQELSVGLGTKAVVMRIPIEYYNEDQEAKMAEINKIEQGIGKSADYGKVELSST